LFIRPTLLCSEALSPAQTYTLSHNSYSLDRLTKTTRAAALNIPYTCPMLPLPCPQPLFSASENDDTRQQANFIAPYSNDLHTPYSH